MIENVAEAMIRSQGVRPNCWDWNMVNPSGRVLLSIELMMNAVNINLIAFSDRFQQVTGQVFAIFVITVAAAEAAVGLGIVIAMFKNKETMNVNEIDLMKW